MTRRLSPRVFERLADAYRARPSYPLELVSQLLALAPPGARVVDMGAGIGHLAEPLARAGARVVAVEPAGAMLAECAERVRGLPVHLVCAPAESTGLPSASVELVLLADAAQWVDPEAAGREASRLLVPGGTAAVVEPRPADTPFMRALEGLLREANPERRPSGPGRARQWLALASGGGRVHTVELTHAAVLSPAALEGVLRSLSFLAPALGPGRMASLLREAATLAQRVGGAHWERILRLSWAHKRRA
ncbi:MAG: class I SAM-dependent methyltransferase [Myxococcaceae bacterium]